MGNRKIWPVYIGIILLLVIALAIFFNAHSDRYAHMAPPELPSPPLKKLAEKHGLQLGSFASLKYLRERPYREILTDQFEYVMADGEPNWSFEDSELRPACDRFDFSHLDRVFQFATDHDLPVRYQHLVWGDEKWLPQWLKQGNYSHDELLSILQQHISTVEHRYQGKVREYTVVNEAFSRKLVKNGNHDWWGERLGTDYIDKSFIWARQNDSHAILILNDFDNEIQNDVSDLMYNYIVDAKARGIPIDGIGMQMHIDGAHAADQQSVVKNMRRFGAIGVKVYVTEFDVNMHDVHLSQADKFKRQAEIYGDMLGACLQVGPQVCPSFGFLGLVDRQSWYHGIGINDAYPLMFNDDYSPKPAFYKIREVLSK